MHPNETPTDAGLVRRLLTAQFPQWADLPIRQVRSQGTDNALYLVGSGMVARLPRIDWAAGQPEKEFRWLPQLAPHLPLGIPVPHALGAPGEGYPWHWTIGPWLEGEQATPERIGDWEQFARDIAAFIAALWRLDPTGGPPPGQHNAGRGVPLARRDSATRAAIAQLAGRVDSAATTAAWQAALDAPPWDGPPVWLHGDLQSGNLLVSAGRLRAVIDFGCLGIGDPACDLAVAWNLLPAASREVFRTTLAVDAATWARGRGWALSVALIALPYYWETNPFLAGSARYTLGEVLAEHRSAG